MIDLRGFSGWVALTDQPFLRLLRQRQVTGRAFERWLVQEQYLYEAILGLQTSLLRRAPQQHRLIKVNALLFTIEELDWLANFELPAAPVHPSRRAYLDFLQVLEQTPYAVGTVAHWARHRAFFDAWSSLGLSDGLCGDAFGLFEELTQHWMAPEAQALLHDLGSLALEVSQQLSLDEVSQVVGRVLELERLAWGMALEFALDDAQGAQSRY